VIHEGETEGETKPDKVVHKEETKSDKVIHEGETKPGNSGKVFHGEAYEDENATKTRFARIYEPEVTNTVTSDTWSRTDATETTVHEVTEAGKKTTSTTTAKTTTTTSCVTSTHAPESQAETPETTK
jgi:hypothetical protein